MRDKIRTRFESFDCINVFRKEIIDLYLLNIESIKMMDIISALANL